MRPLPARESQEMSCGAGGKPPDQVREMRPKTIRPFWCFIRPASARPAGGLPAKIAKRSVQQVRRHRLQAVREELDEIHDLETSPVLGPRDCGDARHECPGHVACRS